MTMIRKTLAATLTAAVLAGSALVATSAPASAHGYGHRHHYNNYYYQPYCFYKKVKVWDYYGGYFWKRIRVCN